LFSQKYILRVGWMRRRAAQITRAKVHINYKTEWTIRPNNGLYGAK